MEELNNKITELQKQVEKLSADLSEGIKVFTSQTAFTDKCELMIYKEYRGAPMIIKDGDIINDNETDSFSISWNKETGFNIKIGNTIM